MTQMFNLSEVEDYWFFPQNICYVESLPLKEYDVFGICTLYIFYTHTHTHTHSMSSKKEMSIYLYICGLSEKSPAIFNRTRIVCTTTFKESGLECICVNNDNFTVLVSGCGRCHWVSMCSVWPLQSKWLSE